MRGHATSPGTPGPAVAPADVANYPDKPLYDTTVLRTVFLDFDNEDWEQELEDFHGTDVDVAAQMQVDGKVYPNVGVHFRGMSSYGHVSRGSKRPFNVSLDMADEDQRIYGYKTLNLLNCHGDPSMMSSVVYSHIARQYIPTPKANFVHVVINGESWGVYVSVQQFDKLFLQENFGASKGTRWKVSGNPNADGGLRYLGTDLDEYKSRYEMKSNDGKKAWKALVELCQTLNETPLEELESALDPILD
ncbi:Spore coat protein CotH domain protein, partial [Rhodopirellula maiorica SM1]